MKIDFSLFKQIFRDNLKIIYNLEMTKKDVSNIGDCFLFTISELIRNNNQISIKTFGNFDKSKRTNNKIHFKQHKFSNCNNFQNYKYDHYYELIFKVPEEIYTSRIFYSPESLNNFLELNYPSKTVFITMKNVKKLTINKEYENEYFTIKNNEIKNVRITNIQKEDSENENS